MPWIRQGVQLVENCIALVAMVSVTFLAFSSLFVGSRVFGDIDSASTVDPTSVSFFSGLHLSDSSLSVVDSFTRVKIVGSTWFVRTVECCEMDRITFKRVWTRFARPGLYCEKLLHEYSGIQRSASPLPAVLRFSVDDDALNDVLIAADDLFDSNLSIIVDETRQLHRESRGSAFSHGLFRKFYLRLQEPALVPGYSDDDDDGKDDPGVFCPIGRVRILGYHSAVLQPISVLGRMAADASTSLRRLHPLEISYRKYVVPGNRSYDEFAALVAASRGAVALPIERVFGFFVEWIVVIVLAWGVLFGVRALCWSDQKKKKKKKGGARRFRVYDGGRFGEIDVHSGMEKEMGALSDLCEVLGLSEEDEFSVVVLSAASQEEEEKMRETQLN